MEEAREPTSEQKAVIRANKLISDMWLVLEETETYLTVIYRHGKSKKKLDKRVDLWKEGKDVSANNQSEVLQE